MEATKSKKPLVRPRTNPYPVFSDGDTGWGSRLSPNRKMTNQEYFSSAAKGGYYEGFEWNEEKKIWVPDAASREKKAQHLKEQNICPHCGEEIKKCICL